MIPSLNLTTASGVWNSYEIAFGAWSLECQYYAISQTFLTSHNLTPASGVWNSYEITCGVWT